VSGHRTWTALVEVKTGRHERFREHRLAARCRAGARCGRTYQDHR
jgi:hypothetical protein